MTRAFGAVTVGDEMPPRERVVTAADVAVYGDVGGDLNPLHRSDEVARAAGFPGIIAHGMFTMGHLASAVVDWAGDAGAIERLSSTFRAPVFMGETIVARGRVRAVDPETRTATLDLEVTLDRDGDTEYPVRKGQATIALAAP